MNYMIELLNSHVSCRQFTGEDISEKQEQLIISTAQRSATSSNLQVYSIVGIRHQATKDKLSEFSGKQSHINNSSLFLVFCADLHRLKTITEKRSYDFKGGHTEYLVLSTVDCALAACRALIAAQAIGIGGCMVGGIRNNPDKVSDLLELPDFVYPVMGMSLGFPVSKSMTKPRLPMPAVYFREKYSPAQIDSAIDEYDRIIDELGYLKDRQLRPEDYPDFDSLYSWSEHTARRLSNDSLSMHRPHMKAFLEQKGFGGK